MWREAAGLVAAAMLLVPGTGAAQTGATTTTYSNTSESETFGMLWGSRCVSRTFESTSTGFVNDVKLGTVVEHSRRGEVSIRLISPAGTSRTLLNTSDSTAANLNVRFDDAASQSVSNYAGASNDSISNAPYQRTYRPAQTLSGFDGQAAAGTWTLEICDTASTNSSWGDWYGGTFRSAELTITSSQRADLSLSMSVSSSSPASGANVTYTLNLNNSAGSSTAANVTVEDVLPAGTSFVSSSGNGSYDSETGIWTLAQVAGGSTHQLRIIARVTATQGAPITNVAEVASSSLFDPDSTPGNGANEDDRASATFTVSGTRTAGTSPNLTCPAGSLLFDWDGRSWSGGSTSGNYNLTGLGTVNFALSNQGQWLNLDQLGGQTPRTGNAITGGYSPAQNVLIQAVNMANRSQVASTVITLPAAVSGAQFRIFDVDYNENQFADRVRVVGSLGGVPVMPTLTNGTSNYVIGNEAFGDVVTDDNRSGANVVVTFTSAIDKITVEYGNWSDAPSDPGQQAIALHDILMCAPGADLAVSKSSAIAGDAALAYNVPGTDVIYTITVANNGPAALTGNSLFLVDPLPPQTTFFFGDADGNGPGTQAVNFANSGSGLTWNYGTDVRFSNGSTTPTSLAQCTYTPTSQLDTNVKYICINPKGVMAGKTGSTTPSFGISFRTRVK